MYKPTPESVIHQKGDNSPFVYKTVLIIATKNPVTITRWFISNAGIFFLTNNSNHINNKTTNEAGNSLWVKTAASLAYPNSFQMLEAKLLR